MSPKISSKSVCIGSPLLDLEVATTSTLVTSGYVRYLLVDFRKAFDTVNHFIPIEKLQKLDISHIVINWIINFLTNRTQQVVVNGRRSSRESITRSIVQGSGL